MAEEKPFKPSKKRLEKARKEGRTLKSQVLTQGSAVSALLLFVVIGSAFPMVRNKILLQYILLEGFREPELCLVILWEILQKAVIGGLIFGASVSILVEAAQVGLSFDTAVLTPKASHFDIAAGLKKVLTGLRQSWLTLVNLGLLVLLFSCFFRIFLAEASRMFFISEEQALVIFRNWCSCFALTGCGLLLALGALEYWVRRKAFFKELSMSHEEVKREQKDLDGDPRYKSMRRAQHEALMMQNLVARVRKSKVVIVEPN